jgi:hypothetical protein
MFVCRCDPIDVISLRGARSLRVSEISERRIGRKPLLVANAQVVRKSCASQRVLLKMRQYGRVMALFVRNVVH